MFVFGQGRIQGRFSRFSWWQLHQNDFVNIDTMADRSNENLRNDIFTSDIPHQRAGSYIGTGIGYCVDWAQRQGSNALSLDIKSNVIILGWWKVQMQLHSYKPMGLCGFFHPQARSGPAKCIGHIGGLLGRATFCWELVALKGSVFK